MIKLAKIFVLELPKNVQGHKLHIKYYIDVYEVYSHTQILKSEKII